MLITFRDDFLQPKQISFCAISPLAFQTGGTKIDIQEGKHPGYQKGFQRESR